jgi:serine protease Do
MKNQKQTKNKRIVSVWAIFCLMVAFGSAMLLDVIWAPEAMARSVMGDVPESFAPLAKKVSPSVVNISTVKVIKGRGGPPLPFGQNDPFRDFFNQFFRNQVPKEFRQKSLGSGFIIDKDGFILTNNHVVEKSDEIKVKLSDESEFEAKIIGRDPKTDLALIKIKPDKSLIPIPFGDSDKLQVGDWVIAIGNPFGLGNTVTAGIVSAKYRQIGLGSYDDFIQTDAPINPGNSGGPLLNTAGEVVGINSAIFSQTGGSVGIGFAIPINMVKDLLPQLKKGKVVRGWLGVMIQKITPELKDKLRLKDERGALVADVTTGGPADKAGIHRGDVIVSFDGKEIREMRDLPYMVASTPVGKTVTVEVMRKGQAKSFQVKIGELEEKKKSQEVSKPEPNLGMTVEEITPELARNLGISETSGLVVVQVEDNTPAAEAGIMPGDVILELDQVPVKNLEQFKQKIKEYKSGETILFLIKRRGATLYLTLKVEE